MNSLDGEVKSTIAAEEHYHRRSVRGPSQLAKRDSKVEVMFAAGAQVRAANLSTTDAMLPETTRVSHGVDRTTLWKGVRLCRQEPLLKMEPATEVHCHARSQQICSTATTARL